MENQLSKSNPHLKPDYLCLPKNKKALIHFLKDFRYKFDIIHYLCHSSSSGSREARLGHLLNVLAKNKDTDGYLILLDKYIENYFDNIYEFITKDRQNRQYIHEYMCYYLDY